MNGVPEPVKLESVLMLKSYGGANAFELKFGEITYIVSVLILSVSSTPFVSVSNRNSLGQRLMGPRLIFEGVLILIPENLTTIGTPSL